MACCGDGDEPKNADNAIQALTPGKRRRCTDVLCLLLFTFFWAGMLVVVGVGFTTGDPDRLVYALDYKFDQCNRDNSAAARGLGSLDVTLTNDDGEARAIKLGGRDHAARPLFYAIGTGEPRFDASYIGVCQTKCPNAGLNEIGYRPEQWVCTGKYYGTSNKPDLSLDKVPKPTQFSKAGIEAFVKRAREFVESPGGLKEQAEYLGSFFLIKGGAANCPDDADIDDPACSVCYPSYPSVEYAPAFCVPNVTFIKENADRVTAVFGSAFNMTAIKEKTDSALGGGAKAAMRIAQDAVAALPVILGCIAFSLVLGFVWAYLMRLFIKPMVGITVAGVAVLLGAFTYLLFRKSSEMRSDGLYGSDETFTAYADVTFGAFAFAAALLCLYVIVVGCFWRRIWLVVGVVIEASKALAAMPTLLFVPILPALLAFGVVIYFLFGAFYILSAAKLKLDGSGYAQLDFDRELQGALAYHFFGCIWSGVLLNHVAWAVIAASVVQWYFAKDKAKDLGLTPVVSATGRVLRFHLGTAVFGSLVVAAVKYVRYVAYALKYYADSENEYYGFLVKYVCCCVDCCLRCFEKLLEFISKQAYILCAIEAEGFCTSARHAFGYALSNLGGIALLNTIGDFFLFLGKLFVAGSAALLCAILLTSLPQYQLGTNSLVLPCVIVMLASYQIAAMFMGIYEMTIDTIFMCFLVDEDKQLGYADGALKGFVKANVREGEKEGKKGTSTSKGADEMTSSTAA